MICITGDIHGNPLRISDLCWQRELGRDDTIVILGDVGLNNDLGSRDREMKMCLSRETPTIFCVHGNHEARPQTVGTYKEKLWNGGRVLYEEVYPNLLFPIDGEIFTLEGVRCMVIGGAYSVDKPLRLAYGAPWFADEQPSEEIKAYVEQQLRAHKVDVIFSHTCPYKYIPREVLLPGADQSTVDDSTERWLDTIEESTDYKLWYCGHWHTEKHIDKLHFLYRNCELLPTEVAQTEQESIFVEGHDSGNYFWIMPVRAVSKDQEGDPEVEEHTAEEISIEAGHVRGMLYYFLDQFYDPSLQEPFRNTQLYGVKFDWDLEHNVYTYASVRKMIGRIREYARLLQTDYDNPVLDALKAGFCPGQFDTGYDSYQEQPDRETVIRKNIYVAIAFYAHFCDRMEVMLKNAPQFEFISFMGP